MRTVTIHNHDETASQTLNVKARMLTDMSGFGQRYSLLDVGGMPYSMDLDFSDIELTILFGIHGNPYEQYRSFSDFLQANGIKNFIIEYTGHSARRCDVWLKRFTKSQITKDGVLEEKITFKRITPWYFDSDSSDLVQTITNTHFLPIPLRWEFSVAPSGDYDISTDTGLESVLTLGASGAFFVDSASRKAMQGTTNIYSGFDFEKNTFLYLQKGTHEVTMAPPGGYAGYKLTVRHWRGD